MKLTNKECVHNNFTFIDGLNIDTVKFNPTGKCLPGGIYFVTIDNWPEWINYNSDIMWYIWDVTIPDDALVYDEKNKFKADKIILKNRIIIWHNNDLSLAAIKQNGWFLHIVRNPTDEICLAAVKQNGLALQHIKNPSDKICLAAVGQNGCALKYVRNPTYEICFTSVKQNGYALLYVNNQTNEICLAAVKQNGYVLKYVKHQTDEICLAAVKQNITALEYVKNQTREICLAVIGNFI